MNENEIKTVKLFIGPLCCMGVEVGRYQHHNHNNARNCRVANRNNNPDNKNNNSLRLVR